MKLHLLPAILKEALAQHNPTRTHHLLLEALDAIDEPRPTGPEPPAEPKPLKTFEQIRCDIIETGAQIYSTGNTRLIIRLGKQAWNAWPTTNRWNRDHSHWAYGKNTFEGMEGLLFDIRRFRPRS